MRWLRPGVLLWATLLAVCSAVETLARVGKEVATARLKGAAEPAAGA